MHSRPSWISILSIVLRKQLYHFLKLLPLIRTNDSIVMEKKSKSLNASQERIRRDPNGASFSISWPAWPFFLQVAIKGIKLIISDHQTFAIGQQDNIILIFFLRTLPVLKIQWTPITISMLGLSERQLPIRAKMRIFWGEGRGQHGTMVCILAYGPNCSGIDSQRSPKIFRGKKLSMLLRFILDHLFFLKRAKWHHPHLKFGPQFQVRIKLVLYR